MLENLEVLYRDEYIVAINKPPGLLVHRTKIATDANEFALQILRNQLKRHVFPIHRLDRKTSGILLFAKQSEYVNDFQQLFNTKQIEKNYYAICRGFVPKNGFIDYALYNENGNSQSAQTKYERIATCELNIAFGKHSSSRYSLVKAHPLTGRMHQIRKHFNHLRHPIIGDRPHGCNKQNKLFKEQFQLQQMLLHAFEIKFIHPFTNQQIHICADFFPEFKRILKIMDWEKIFS